MRISFAILHYYSPSFPCFDVTLPEESQILNTKSKSNFEDKKVFLPTKDHG